MKNHQSMEEIIKNEVESGDAEIPPAQTIATVAAEDKHTMPKKHPEYTTEELGVMMSPSVDPPEKSVSRRREALPQVLATFAKNLLLIAYGMTLGFPTIVIPYLESGEEDNLQLTPSQISWFSSINYICVPIGCLGSGILTTYLGRKRAMMIVNGPLICAWVMLYFAQSPALLYSALCLTGLTGGLLEAPVLTYVAEITTPLMRGILSSTSSMCVILGINSQFIMGNFLYWRTVALINISAPLVAFFALFLVPESPYWLATKNRVDEARKSLAWLRGWVPDSAVEREFNELIETVNAPQHNNDAEDEALGHTATRSQRFNRAMRPYKRATFLKPFLLVTGAFFFGHFCGMTTLQTYAVSIFEELGAPIDPFLATMILGLVELAGTLLCVCVVHYSGKRPLTLISTFGNAICFGIVAAYDMARRSSSLPEEDAASWVPLTFLLSSAFLTHMGIRLLPWILTGEVFPSEVRGMASGAASSVGYIFGFLANKTHFSLVGGLTLAGTFWVYVGVSLAATVIFFFTLPETEGRTLLEINMHFAGKRQPGWKRRLPRHPSKDLKLENGKPKSKGNRKSKSKNKGTNGDATHDTNSSQTNGANQHIGINNDNGTWAVDNPSLSEDSSRH